MLEDTLRAFGLDRELQLDFAMGIHGARPPVGSGP
jgi:hypothetical protein